MEDAPVHQRAAGEQSQADLPEPSGKCQNKIDQDQRPHRIAAHVIQRLLAEGFFLCVQVAQPQGIGFFCKDMPVSGKLDLDGFVLLIFLHGLRPYQNNAEGIRQKSGKSAAFINEGIIFFQCGGGVPVKGVKQFRIRSFIQVIVIEKLRTGELFF